MNVTACACKRGFLVLRDCGRAATATCGECNRGVCAEHFVAEWSLCVDCAARREEVAALAPADDRGTQASREAAYRRARYYRASSYHPFHGGWPSSYYDQYDVRAFDDAVDPWDGGEAGPSFLDS